MQQPKPPKKGKRGKKLAPKRKPKRKYFYEEDDYIPRKGRVKGSKNKNEYIRTKPSNTKGGNNHKGSKNKAQEKREVRSIEQVTLSKLNNKQEIIKAFNKINKSLAFQNKQQLNWDTIQKFKNQVKEKATRGELLNTLQQLVIENRDRYTNITWNKRQEAYEIHHLRKFEQEDVEDVYAAQTIYDDTKYKFDEYEDDFSGEDTYYDASDNRNIRVLDFLMGEFNFTSIEDMMSDYGSDSDGRRRRLRYRLEEMTGDIVEKDMGDKEYLRNFMERNDII